MKKTLIALATILALTGSASADGYYHRRGYGGNNWFAPLVGGLIIGGVVGAMAQPRYQELPPYHTECRPEPIYDRYGQFLGYQRQCYNVPNY